MATPHPFPEVHAETPILGGSAAMTNVYEDAQIGVFVFRCLHDSSEMREEREHLRQVLSLQFSGVSQTSSGSSLVQLDPLTAVWHQVGQGYRSSHPWGCGCRGVKLRLGPELAEPLNWRAQARGLQAFTVPPAAQLAIRRLLAGIGRGDVVEPLAIEEEVVRVASAILSPPSRSPTASPATAEVHDRCVHRARTYMQRHFRERVRLDQLARVACASPDHLTRIFRRQTGMTLHQYLVRLRLSAALDRLTEGSRDLTALALELGFASHSHFTLAFRECFGAPPSRVRLDIATARRTNRHRSGRDDRGDVRDPRLVSMLAASR
jgi:AraC family transcriptional regulator